MDGIQHWSKTGSLRCMSRAEYAAMLERESRNLRLLEGMENGSLDIAVPTVSFPRIRPRYVCNADIEPGGGRLRLCFGTESTKAGYISIECSWGTTYARPSRSPSDDLGSDEPEWCVSSDSSREVNGLGNSRYWVQYHSTAWLQCSGHFAISWQLRGLNVEEGGIEIEPDSGMHDYRWAECPSHRLRQGPTVGGDLSKSRWH